MRCKRNKKSQELMAAFADFEDIIRWRQKNITMGSRHFASFPHHLGSFPHQICFISPKKLLHLPNNMLHKIISYHIISPTDCFNFYKKILTSPTLFCVTIGKVSQKKMRKSVVIHQTGSNSIFERKKGFSGTT